MHRFAYVTSVVVVTALLAFASCDVDEGGGPAGGVSTFTEFPGPALSGVYYCSVAWGDCDNDGDLDIAVAGATGSGRITTVYENDGAGGLTEFSGLGLAGVTFGCLAWGDCDNDGDLDLAVAGTTLFSDPYDRVLKIYENNGAGGFTELANLTGFGWCSLAWGDCDNDGDLDLAVAGSTDSGNVTTIYENDGLGGFTELSGLSLAGVLLSSLAWGDCDNDGDLDLAVAGETSGGGRITTVYENNGAGSFAEFTGIALPGLNYCALALGDCDSDGDLDLAVAGTTGSGRITTVYENNGSGDFVEFPGLSLTGVDFCSLAWGDCDSDGDLDLAVAGSSWDGGWEYITKVYENDGLGGFTELPDLDLTGVQSCSLAWGDADNDGDLDLAVAGSDGYSWTTKVYENKCVIANARPEAPTGLAATPAPGEAVLSWNEGLDTETPTPGLSYNLKVVGVPSTPEWFPAMAGADGRRLIPALGPVPYSPSTPGWTLKLPTGAYLFQVQAIDSSLEGGPWSAPVPFTVP